jgi:hypothetical protein
LGEAQGIWRLGEGDGWRSERIVVGVVLRTWMALQNFFSRSIPRADSEKEVRRHAENASRHSDENCDYTERKDTWAHTRGRQEKTLTAIAGKTPLGNNHKGANTIIG